MQSSRCNSFEDQAPVDEIHGCQIFKRVAVTWAPFQYPIRRLIVRPRKASKARDRVLKCSYRFEILLALRQQCCRCACQISERSDNSKYKSRGIDTRQRYLSYDKTSYRIVKRGPGDLRCDWSQGLIFSNGRECDTPYYAPSLLGFFSFYHRIYSTENYDLPWPIFLSFVIPNVVAMTACHDGVTLFNRLFSIEQQSSASLTNCQRWIPLKRAGNAESVCKSWHHMSTPVK